MAANVTIRPDSTRLNSGGWRDQNGNFSPGHNEINDANDGTYIFGTSGTHEIQFYTGLHTLLSNQRCASARLYVRVSSFSTGFTFNSDHWLRPEGIMGDGAFIGFPDWIVNDPTNYSALYDAEFDNVALFNLVSCHRQNNAGVTTCKLYDTWVDIDVRTRPTIDATGPGAHGSTGHPRRPRVTWDANYQGDSARHFIVHIRRLSDSALVHDSGWVWGAPGFYDVPIDLEPGVAYASIVNVSSDFRGADWWSDWSDWHHFTIDTVPSTTVTGPSGVITTTNTPTVTFTYTGGTAKNAHHVKIFAAQDYDAPGFNPETWLPVYNSNEVGGAGLTQATNVALLPGTNYKAFAKVRNANNMWSAWATGPVFSVTVSAADKPGRVFFATSGIQASPAFGYIEFDDTKRAGQFFWKSAPMRTPDGRQVEIREVHVYCKSYDPNATIQITVGTSTKTQTLVTPGRHQLTFLFRERDEVLDVRLVSTAGTQATNEAPSIEVVRIGWRPLHLLR